MTSAPVDPNHQRDSSSLRVLGTFFALLGLTVTVATYWALGEPRAALVNFVSGIVLTSIGIGSWVIAGRLGGGENGTPAERD